MEDDKPLLNKCGFGNQPIKNGGWTSREISSNIYQSPPPPKKVQLHFQEKNPVVFRFFHLENTELFQTLKGAQGATPPLQIVPRIDEMAT